MPYMRAKEVLMVSLESHVIIQKIVGILPPGLDGKAILSYHLNGAESVISQPNGH